MNFKIIELCYRGLAVGLVCFLSVSACAQTQVANQSGTESLVPAEIASVNQPKTISVTANKPHDDEFVIGNGDQLAISVWKQPDLSRTVPVDRKSTRLNSS